MAMGSDYSAFAGGPVPDVQFVWSMPLLCGDYGAYAAGELATVTESNLD